MWVCGWCQLKEEIGRCEVLKLDNIHRVIGCVRQQLREWQEKCCISDEECNAFQPLHEGPSLLLFVSTACRVLRLLIVIVRCVVKVFWNYFSFCHFLSVIKLFFADVEICPKHFQQYFALTCFAASCLRDCCGVFISEIPSCVMYRPSVVYCYCVMMKSTVVSSEIASGKFPGF